MGRWNSQKRKGAPRKRSTQRLNKLIGGNKTAGTKRGRNGTPPISTTATQQQPENTIIVSASKRIAKPYSDGSYNTIYDYIIKNKKNEYNYEEDKLYYYIAKLLSIVAISDLRHDFEDSININFKINKNPYNVIEEQIKHICQTFYNKNTTKYNDFFNELTNIYYTKLDYNSDTVLRNYVLNEMDTLFLDIIPKCVGVTFSAYDIFNNHYKTFNECCVVGGAQYKEHGIAKIKKELEKGNTSTNKKALLKNKLIQLTKLQTAKLDKIRNDIPVFRDVNKLALLIDAQLGNPIEKMFNKNYSEQEQKPAFIHNYATAMDAATKMVNIPYMNIYVQENKPLTIYPIMSLYDAEVNVVSFKYDPQSEKGQWKTSICTKIDNECKYPKVLSGHTASVNNLALVPLRNTQRDNKKYKLNIPNNINIVSTNHLYKSLGDRLQICSIANITTDNTSINQLISLNYKKFENLKTSTPESGASSNTLAGHQRSNIVFVTNDYFAAYQAYLMGVNIFFTGVDVVSYYSVKSDQVRPVLPTGQPQAHLIIINKIMDISSNLSNAFNAIKNPPITILTDISDTQYATTLFNAIYNRNLIQYINKDDQYIQFVNLFITSSNIIREKLEAVINEKNYTLFEPFLSLNDANLFTKLSILPDISLDGLEAEFTKIEHNINNKLTKKNNIIDVNNEKNFKTVFEICTGFADKLVRLGFSEETSLQLGLILICKKYSIIRGFITDDKLYEKLVDIESRRGMYKNYINLSLKDNLKEGKTLDNKTCETIVKDILGGFIKIINTLSNDNINIDYVKAFENIKNEIIKVIKEYTNYTDSKDLDLIYLILVSMVMPYINILISIHMIKNNMQDKMLNDIYRLNDMNITLNLPSVPSTPSRTFIETIKTTGAKWFNKWCPAFLRTDNDTTLMLEYAGLTDETMSDENINMRGGRIPAPLLQYVTSMKNDNKALITIPRMKKTDSVNDAETVTYRGPEEEITTTVEQLSLGPVNRDERYTYQREFIEENVMRTCNIYLLNTWLYFNSKYDEIYNSDNNKKNLLFFLGYKPYNSMSEHEKSIYTTYLGIHELEDAVDLMECLFWNDYMAYTEVSLEKLDTLYAATISVFSAAPVKSIYNSTQRKKLNMRNRKTMRLPMRPLIGI